MKHAKTSPIGINISKKIYIIFVIIFVIILISGIGSIFITIYNGRLVGDDFSSVAIYRNNWLQNSLTSLASTGRYMQSIFASIGYGLFRSKSAIFLPLLALVSFCGTVYLYTRKTIKTVPKLASLSFSVGFVFLCYFVNRSVLTDGTWFAYQDFFFTSAIVTYTIALLLAILVIYVYLFKLKDPLSIKNIVLLAAILYLLGLSNEIQPATTFCIGLGLLILSFIQSKKIHIFQQFSKWRKPIIAVTVASLASLITMYFSPSSIHRRQLTGGMDSPDKIGGILRGIKELICSYYFRPSDLILIASFVALFFIGFKLYIKKKSDKQLATTFIIGVIFSLVFIGSVVVARTMVVFGYGSSSSLLPRTLLIPQILYVTSTSILFYCLYEKLYKLFYKKQATLILTLVACLIIGLIYYLPKYGYQISSQLGASVNYASFWDRENTILINKSKNNTSAIIYLPDQYAGLGDGFSIKCYGPYSSSTDWLNAGIEQYYSVKKVCAESEL